MRRIFLLLAISLLSACATQSPPVSVVVPTPSATPQLATPRALLATPTPVVSASPTPSPSPTQKPTPKPVMTEAQGRALMAQLLPPKINDRNGWIDDMLDAFTALKIAYTPENICAVAAVIEQESTWQGDPVVPGLPKIVWNAIGERADKYHIPLIAVQTALLKPSPTGQSYKARIDNLRTEREMNDLFEDLANEAKSLNLPLNMKNPIRTGGPMQVSVEFAQQHSKVWPYPYPIKESIRHEVFTRRGGVYFGTAILLQYPATYTDVAYRFADFNAGRYASRNAAFQKVLSHLSGKELVEDGDLLSYSNGVPSGTSDVQTALYSMNAALGMSRDEMLRDLKQEKLVGFSQTELYQKVYALADKGGKTWPRASMPQIDLKSPKITRKLTTEWFANRVKGRFETCIKRLN
ncbi:DUF1615 domain-containing protein [Chitinibacter bivalviorum]|uniref:DUF1615 domain-containing protein n=1 Tax=Chitinibacter bivalviorum TaxID=2739434 RepID=A0A7H9BM92_9NEIS|nr:DUF1615 domain-containing protein [Chitinibacter bivalviorum]QLG89757.1 DUF1615 domain-containing protein [Chitinibacter bivalviorum]